MEYRQFNLGELSTNCYLLWSGKEAGVIDPGGPAGAVSQVIDDLGLQLKWIVNTHGHADHIAGNAELQKKYGAPIYIHEADRSMLTSAVANLSSLIGSAFTSPDANNTLKAGEIVKLDNEDLMVIETPGHTPGGISLYTKGLLFSGDALFRESIGRSDLPGGDYQQLIQALKERVMVLPPETIVLPGHEAPSTIGHELEFNPYID